MFKPQRINDLIQQKKLTDKRFTLVSFCTDIGMTTVGLSHIIKGESNPSAIKLETIANYFGVDMNYFFDEYDRKSAIPINGASPDNAPDNQPIKPEDESESLYKELFLQQKEISELLRRENEHLKVYTQSNIVREKNATVG